MEDDWIEWHGGECPVAGDARVTVKLRDGWVLHDDDPEDRADGWNWQHDCSPIDIVAYRPYTGA